MALQNQWVGYLDRSYSQIKKSLLRRLGETNPEITDHSESNILVVIISMFSGITEMLNYYIDNMAREAHISTARRYSSVVKITRLIDYRIKTAIPASADLKLTITDELDFVIPGANSFTIPSGTNFNTANGISFITLEDITISTTGQHTIPVVQKSAVNNSFIGNTTGAMGQTLILEDGYVHNSLLLNIGGEVWERVDTLGRSNPTDKHYIVEVSEDKKAYIKFGDNINGAVPEGNREIFGDYFISAGAEGNVSPNTINLFDFPFENYITNQVNITNETKATGGTDYENLERIRRSAPLSLRTLDRAVTRPDFIDVTKLAPGVDKVKLDYSCGEYISLYITPNGGGIAQSALRESTKNYVDERRTLNSRVRVLPAGESEIVLKMDITAKFRRDGLQTKEDAKAALLEAYSYNNSDINKPIRNSDVIALVDNLEKVDYLTLQEMYLIPYFRPVDHNNILNKSFKTLKTSQEINHWQIRFYGTHFKLFREHAYVSDIQIDETYIDPGSNFNITVGPGNYVNGQVWEFSTYPYNQNIETEDFTVPILKEENLTLTVEEQLISN